MNKHSLIDGLKSAHVALMMNLNGVDDAASMHQPSPGGNCINWITGHLLVARDSMMKMFGGKPFMAEGEDEVYKRGSDGLNADDAHIDLARLVEGLENTHKQGIAALEAMPDEMLDKELDPSTFPVPVEYPTVGTMLGLFMFHEGYHTGQIGLARRVAGMESVIK